MSSLVSNDFKVAFFSKEARFSQENTFFDLCGNLTFYFGGLIA